MNLYIESIKLWFKGFSENSQRTITYPFIPNKINVITGDSSTGKSSILGIIDYLFLSDNPVIVENIVNENVEFYGMHLYLNGTSYILIRKAPHFGKGSQDVYWEKQQEYPTPYTPTHTVGNMRALLTCMFKVPKHEEKVGHKTYPMTFRHFLPFNYLTEDIYNPQIQISAESETKRSIFREKDKTKRSKKESAQHSKSRNKSFVMTSVSAL